MTADDKGWRRHDGADAGDLLSPKPLPCRRYRRPYTLIADFTRTIARQPLRILAIRLNALFDGLPIVR